MILITGYRGFIGSRLFAKTNALGIDVRDGNNLLTCDLPGKIDVVYHLAAQSDVNSSWSDPLHDLDNIRMTARLVKEYPRAKIIYANSCASINRSSPYGFSKWASAEYLKQFHTNYVNCVFPNIYGEGSRSVVDRFKNSAEVTIYGDGSHVRDYVHVDDIVNGLVLAQNWPMGDYCMGSGTGSSVLDVLELAGPRIVSYQPELREDANVVIPNTTPDWTPKITLKKYL